MSKMYLHLPSVEQLKKHVEEWGLFETVKRYSSYEFLIGTTESLEYLECIIKEYKRG